MRPGVPGGSRVADAAVVLHTMKRAVAAIPAMVCLARMLVQIRQAVAVVMRIVVALALCVQAP